MNINETLATFLEEDKPLLDTDLNNRLIAFLRDSISEKQSLAQNLIKELVKQHNKEELVTHITELYEVESATMSLTGKRDHVVHAINTFILGLYINNEFLNNEFLNNESALFQWKLSSLFHDIAYPLEISQQIIQRYAERINKIQNDLDVPSKEVYFNLVPRNLLKLRHNVLALSLLQKRIDEFNIDLDLKQKYDEMVKSNRMDHGIISSLTVLYLVDLMYEKNNPERKHLDYSGWTQENFENDVLPACLAIYLHNLEPTGFFDGMKGKFKLGYLLKLCDELQNWDRPNNKNPNGDSPENYDIEVSNNKLIFKVKTDELKDKIFENIKCLKDTSIEVIKNE